MEPTDELFPVVKMGPKRSYKIEISTPGRIATLEAEVERLRDALLPFYHTDWPHLIHNHVDQQDQALAERFARAMREIHVALEPAQAEEERDV